MSNTKSEISAVYAPGDYARVAIDPAFSEAEVRWRQLLDLSPDPVFLHQNDRIVFVNQAMIALVKADSPEELVGKSPLIVIDARDHDLVRSRIADMIENKAVPQRCEQRWRTLGGDVLEVEVNAGACEWAGGAAIQVAARDNGARRETLRRLRDSETTFRVLYENAPLPYQSLDENGCILAVNRAWELLLGRTEQEVKGHSFGEYLRPEYRPLFVNQFSLFKMCGAVRGVEFMMVHKDGTEALVAADGNIGCDESGAFRQTHCILKDITEKRRSEEALQRSEERLRLALEIACLGTWHYDAATDTNEWSERTLSIHGLTVPPKGFRGMRETIYWEDREKVVAALGSSDPPDGSIELEHRIVRSDGAIRIVQSRGRANVDEQGRLVSLEGVVQDITEQRAAVEEQEKLAALVDSVQDFVSFATLEAECLYINPAGRRLLGMPETDSHPVMARDLIAPECLTFSREVILAHVKDEGAYAVEINLMHQVTGERIPVMMNAFSVPDRLGNLRHIACVCSDLRETKRHEEAHRKTETMLHAILDNSPAIIAVKDNQGRILMANNQFDTLFDLAPGEAIGRPITEIIPDPAVRRLLLNDERVQQTRESLLVEEEVPIRGATRTFLSIKFPLNDADDSVVATVGISTDITERKKLEEQFLRAQKMEGFGRLAGGIAHDFRNLLSVVLGYAELLEADLPPKSPLLSSVEKIQTAANRAAGLTAQLLSFARRDIRQVKVLDVNTLLKDMGQMLRPVIGENIALEIEADAAAPRVSADASQIEQVVMNLVINSCDAMPQGGKIAIKTSNVTFAETNIGSETAVEPGDYLLIAVADNGAGMSREVQSHIFEPFFTTKDVGKGTGLGLATCYGIVRQHGGYIWPYSEEGLGTTFKIYLPVETSDVEVNIVAEAARARRGRETVLVAEDEALLRALSANALRRHGYEVIEASNGTEGLALAAAHHGEIHLLLTDMVMPEMGGQELLKRLSPLRPGMKALCVSGYTEEAFHVPEGTVMPPLLQKPFTSDVLLRRVREVLDEKPA